MKLAAGAVLAPDIPGMLWPDIGMDELVLGSVEACSLGGLQADSARAAAVAVPATATVAIDANLNMIELLENWMGLTRGAAHQIRSRDSSARVRTVHGGALCLRRNACRIRACTFCAGATPSQYSKARPRMVSSSDKMKTQA